MFHKLFFFGLLLCALMTGCTNNQSSSLEEVLYQSTQLDSWKENLWIFNFSSGGTLGFPDDPYVYRSIPFINEYSYLNNSSGRVVYLSIWRDKQGKNWVSGFNDSRPPCVVFTEPLVKEITEDVQNPLKK